MYIGRFERELYTPLPSLIDRHHILSHLTSSWIPPHSPIPHSSSSSSSSSSSASEVRDRRKKHDEILHTMSGLTGVYLERGLLGLLVLLGLLGLLDR